MTFQTIEEIPDTAAQLRKLEPQAPVALRAVMVKAAGEIEVIHRRMADWAQSLELAASLRIGQMDSQSRVDDIEREIKLTMTSIASGMREYL